MSCRNYKLAIFMYSFFFCTEMFALELVHRNDLQAKLSSIACGENANFTWRDLVKQGIYDANIVFQKLELKPGNNFVEKDIEAAAKQLARQNFHNGFAFGTCSEKKIYWISSMPAKASLGLDAKGLIQIPSEALFSSCSQTKIEFAQADVGFSRMLFNLDSKKSYDQLQINSHFLNDGILSVSCLSRENSNLGPILWSIFPVKNGPSQSVPYAEVFNKSDSIGELQVWLEWLNSIRRELKIVPLKLAMDKSVLNVLSPLLISGSAFHDRKLNSQTRTELKKQRLNMVGETRVIGSDLEEASWLLWNSPSHRSLLTSQKVNRVSILKKTFSEDFLTVLIFSSAETIKPKSKVKKP